METIQKLGAVVGAITGSICSWLVVFNYLLPWLEVTSNARLVGFLIWVFLGWGTGAIIGYVAGLIVIYIILFLGIIAGDIIKVIFKNSKQS